ncbi:MAG TPA: hemerythrin domain-containing protein [Dermatophilaceae bacterium]|nr:hemerythrin domain-containing protein [Dermatophilaceae bacterium]
MCSYCGCRSIGPIGDLSREHTQIQNLCGEVRRATDRGEHERAVAHLAELAVLLERHDSVEELSLYPAMARQPEYREKVGVLFDEHDDVDSIVATALATARERGAAEVEWAPVLGAFGTLVEHIQHEENGLFPAAAIALDPADWEHAERVRRQAG